MRGTKLRPRRRIVGRAGTTLLELLLSLVLLVTVVSLGADLLAFQRQTLARIAGDARAQTVLRHAVAPLAAQLRLLDPNAPAVVADTVIDALTTIGDGVLCAPADGTARLLVPAPEVGNDAALGGWRVRPDAGDVAIVTLARDGDANEWRALVTAVESGGGARCAYDGESPADADAPAMLVRLVAPPPPGARAGAPVRFARRIRHSLYRTGDGSWALGHRRCSADPPVVCQGVQPVAGPLRAAGNNDVISGMRVVAITGHGVPTIGADMSAAAIVLRAERATPAGMRHPRLTRRAADSVSIRVGARSARR